MDFNPRSPQGGATSPSISMASSKSISIHAPRKGERLVVQPLILACYIFQSTLPARGSDLFDHEFIGFLIPHFNPRSPQGGATRFRVCYRPAWLNFNPRSPQGGATDSYQDSKGNLHHFNPRSPQGGATISIFVNNSGQVDFNPRSPQGGATTTEDKSSLVAAIFQSTLPARGSDDYGQYATAATQQISIHAPRKGERLPTDTADTGQDKHFNPRSPQGGATESFKCHCFTLLISIHAPRKGERQEALNMLLSGVTISIHAPRKGERLSGTEEGRRLYEISIHAPRKGERHNFFTEDNTMTKFQSTLPARGSDRPFGR